MTYNLKLWSYTMAGCVVAATFLMVYAVFSCNQEVSSSKGTVTSELDIRVTPHQQIQSTGIPIAESPLESSSKARDLPAIAENQQVIGPPNDKHVAPPQEPILLPAIFGSQELLNGLDSEQKLAAADIAQKFTVALQSSGLDPNTPAYQDAWNAAANSANQELTSRLGEQLFFDLQRKSAMPSEH